MSWDVARRQVGKPARLMQVADEVAQHKQKMNSMEVDFLARVHSNKVFLSLLGLLSRRTGMSVEDLETLVEEICHLCWSEADLTMAADEHQDTMRAELERLKRQMAACNLSAHQQIQQLKAGGGTGGNSAITFHEPLQYLDQATRDLVSSLVLEQVKLIESGNAPPSLMEALSTAAPRGHQSEFTGSKTQQLAAALEKLQEVTEELLEARAMQADAEETVAKLSEQLKDLPKIEELKEEVIRQQAEIEELRAQADVQQEEQQIWEAKVEALEGARHVDICEVQTDMAGEDLNEQENEIRKLRVMLEELQMRFRELLDKCKERGIAEHVTEIAEEMGIATVFTSPHRAVFQRLYQDAQRRADKLERIRQCLKSERETEAALLRGESTKVRRLLLDEAGDVPVLKAVEQSELKFLKNMWPQSPPISPGRPGGPVQPAPPEPVRATVPESSWKITPMRNIVAEHANPRGGPLEGARRRDNSAVLNAANFMSKLKLNTSASLPSIPASQVAAHRLEAAQAGLDKVVDRLEGKSCSPPKRTIKRCLL